MRPTKATAALAITIAALCLVLAHAQGVAEEDQATAAQAQAATPYLMDPTTVPKEQPPARRSYLVVGGPAVTGRHLQVGGLGTTQMGVGPARAQVDPIASPSDTDAKVRFNNWMREHNKTFPEDAIPFRFQVWKQHLDFILAHNQENHTYLLGMNADGAMTDDEFRRLRLGYVPTNQSVFDNAPEDEVRLEAPQSVDWRLRGAVTPIKDQGDCGSCYTFVATATIEGAMAIQGSQLVSLSESQLLDCTKPYGNQGCNGGLMDNCFKYAVEKGGLCSEEEYPYTPKVSTCRGGNCEKVAGTNIRGFVKVRKNDEKTALLQAVAKQPVAVAVQGDSAVFRFYKSGIFDNVKCGTNLNHAVAAIGYDTANSPFWILKNQWGTSWGEQGFMRMVRNKNMCGVAKDASYPRF